MQLSVDKVVKNSLEDFNSEELTYRNLQVDVDQLPQQTIDLQKLGLKFKGELGQGRYGIVEKYIDSEGIKYALKRIKPELSETAFVGDHFIKEINTVKSLDHPNIVKFIGVANGAPQKISQTTEKVTLQSVHFAQEMLAGGTLNEVLLKQMMIPHGKLYSGLQALKWALQLSSALEYLHQRKLPILHRDFNCKNILLDSKNIGKASLKIVDFGLHTVLSDDKLPKYYNNALEQKNNNNNNIINNNNIGNNNQPKRCQKQDSMYHVLTGDDIKQEKMNTSQFFYDKIDENSLTQENLQSQQLQQQKSNSIPQKSFENIIFKKIDTKIVKEKTLEEKIVGFDGDFFENQSSDSDCSEKNQNFCRKFCLTGNTGCYMYMAPEVIHNENYNEKCDIYSLGCILFEIFCRRLRIFDIHYDLNEERLQMHALQMASGFRPPFPGHLNEIIKNIISDCWHQLPEKRPYAREVKNRFQELIDNKVETTKQGWWNCFYL